MLIQCQKPIGSYKNVYIYTYNDEMNKGLIGEQT